MDCEDELKSILQMGSNIEAKNWQNLSIYKVADRIKNLNPKAYIPQLVSFGPYHCKDRTLKVQMDLHKARAFAHFIMKSRKPLRTIMNSMREIVPELMGIYDSLDINWSPDDFLKEMLLDGCFMLEILRSCCEIRKPEDTYGSFFGVNDPVFSYHGKVYVMPFIRRDMLILENQLPMSLLVKLLTVEATVDQDPVIYLNKMILHFVNPDYNGSSSLAHKGSLHVLDLYRMSLIDGDHHIDLPSSKKIKEKKTDYEPSTTGTRSAEKLHERGIEFWPSRTKFLTDISFDQGKLKLPSIIVDDSSEAVFLNLIAFERVHVKAGSEITSYVFLMSSIIWSAKDVNLFITSNIIGNFLGSEKSVADLFIGISREITPDPNSALQSVYFLVQTYSKKKWNVRLLNPWASGCLKNSAM